MGREVDLEATVAAPARRAPVGAAAQHRLHARHHLGRRGRLDDVVVGAQGQAAQLVVVLAAGAEEQQRHVGALADAPAHVEARRAGQHHVEQDAVDVVAPQRGDRAARVVGGHDAEALDRQEVGEQPDDLGLVLDEQDGRGAHVRQCRAATARARRFSSDLHRLFGARSRAAGALGGPASKEREHEQVHHDPGRGRRVSGGGDRSGRAAGRRGRLEDAAPAGGAGRRDFSAFVSCLRSHGLADAPADPAALKPWLGAREASDRDAVKAAMAACDDKLPPKPAGVAEGPDVKDVIACVRGHGVDAPTEPDAFKRWLDRTRRTRAPWTPSCATAR